MHIYKLRINNKLKKDETRVWLQKSYFERNSFIARC